VTTKRPSARGIALPALAAFACSVLAYVVFRRPLMYADAALTGMRFHIGPHREQ
jgi:hypothetical protein